jgi:transposase-like protein
MNPREPFCPNMSCPARRQVGKENIRVHSQKDKRWICEVCGRTFTTTTGTIFYRLRSDPPLVMWVIVLLAYGCPIQAIVNAFGLDERTVGDWQARAGQHCQQVHEHLVESSQHDLEQVQADEIKVKTQKGTFWMALAIWVPTRLWLDGLASYVSAFRNAFRSKFPRQAGEPGRGKMVSWKDIVIVQVVKQRLEGVLNIERRIVQGAEGMVEHLIKTTQGKGVINTAFIERLNATFRQRIHSLTRRTCTLAQRSGTLTSGMYSVGCFYNFCDFHHSLRLKLSVGSFDYRWVQRTPAIVARLTDHPWTPTELFNFKVPPARWKLPKQRRRPSTVILQLAQQWAS